MAQRGTQAEDEYRKAATARYHEVLDSAKSEKEMQTVFEEHPCLMPGAFMALAGHGAYMKALITQPELQGIGDRQPDFMWLTRDSGTISPVLIEIERPDKKWVTTGKNPQQTAELTQALNQIRQWREWMDQPANRLVFLEQYGIPENWRRRRFVPFYLLIYGRRAENRDEIAKMRAELERRDQALLTFDHITPDTRQTGYISVRRVGTGRFRALHMPASAHLNPSDPDSWSKVEGRAEMVDRNPWISDERKRFLIEDRIPHWDDWAEHYYERQRAARQARQAERKAQRAE